MCAGQEAAVHAMQSLFHSSTQAVLLADASNAFNCLNRRVSLHNIHFICPPLAVTLANMYRKSSSLFIDGEHILSEEGTTQGDPLAMAMYALSTVPLINRLEGLAAQVWFADDDAAAAGSLVDLLIWWKQLSTLHPGYGYHVNASKSWLVVKDENFEEACILFKGTSLRITTEGRPYLGAPLGSPEFISTFLEDKVSQWQQDVLRLSRFSSSQPHASYSAMVHGLSSPWTFLSRTVRNLSSYLTPVEEAIRLHLPRLCLHPPNDSKRAVLALPIRFGVLDYLIRVNPPRTATTFQFQSLLP